MNPYFIGITLLGASLPVFAPSGNLRLARRIFWVGVVTAVVGAFFIFYPPDWQSGLLISALAGGLMILRAYFSSSYLKFGDKIYAYWRTDSNPGSDASTSAGTSVAANVAWWWFVPVAAGCAVVVGSYLADPTEHSPWLAVAAAAAVVFIAVFQAYDDARRSHPVAQGQRLPFVIVGLITAGVFWLLYLSAYYVWKRRRPTGPGPPSRSSCDPPDRGGPAGPPLSG